MVPGARLDPGGLALRARLLAARLSPGAVPRGTARDLVVLSLMVRKGEQVEFLERRAKKEES